MGKTRKDSFRFDPRPKFKKQKRESNNRGFAMGLDPEDDGEDFDPYDDPADLEEDEDEEDSEPFYLPDVDDKSDRADLDE